MSANAEVISFHEDRPGFPNIIMDASGDAASSFQEGRNSPEQVPVDSIKVLPTTFVPGEWDVICQRGSQNYYHIGTRKFRLCINNHLNSYVAAETKREKSMVITTIVGLFRKNTHTAGGGFIRKDLLKNRWYEVSEKIAREKVGQALRDAAITRKEQEKESDEKAEESNSSLRKRRQLPGEDDYEDRRPSPALDFLTSLQQQDGVAANLTSGVGVTPPAAISSMFSENQQRVLATMMPPPLHFGVGSVPQNTVARIEELFLKTMGTERGASISSSSISSKNCQSLGPPWSKLDDHHKGTVLPPVIHYDDNHLMPSWSLADLEPRPLRPPSPRVATDKERNDFNNSAWAVVSDEDDQQHVDKKERGTCQHGDISPEEAKSYYV